MKRKNETTMNGYNGSTLAIIFTMIAIIGTAAIVSIYNMAHI